MTEERRLLLRELKDTGRAAVLIRRNVQEARDVVGPWMPIEAARIAALQRRERVEIDAFLFQFLQLAGLLQDKLTRLILQASEQDLSRASTRDMRHMLEKLHALEPGRDFAGIAEIRNRLAQDYPLQSERKAVGINTAFGRSLDLLGGCDDMLAYVNRTFFGAEAIAS